MKEGTLCPFSKPIVGRWCRCVHARVSDRCAGKMICTRTTEYRASCVALADLLRERSRFVLGSRNEDSELTHAQSMKIRCGGLLGMQRVLGLDTVVAPSVLEVIAAIRARYADLAGFPFNEIVKDIQAFSHRKKRSRH